MAIATILQQIYGRFSSSFGLIATVGIGIDGLRGARAAMIDDRGDAALICTHRFSNTKTYMKGMWSNVFVR
jgi:hypothetical protein